MSSFALRVANLSKQYRIGARRGAYRTLRESLTDSVTLSVRAVRSGLRRYGSRESMACNGNGRNTVWALKDLTFDVQKGDVVAVIGRNGAGKSTLLKILSRITEPTRGYADVYGSVGSLLEVGTGFHPELSGWENILLNGAILGMTRADILKKFDQIVDFAGVEKFIDTPIKRYSTGMHLRLAFSVAAHLEPEILLVDEVLAVGDVEFQRKCMGRMDEVAGEGRTVLFVSHNMGAVRSLCKTGIFLNEGQIEEAGDVSSCISRYFQSVGAMEMAQPDNHSKMHRGTEFGRVSINDGSSNTIDQSQPFEASVVLRLEDMASGFYLHCILQDMHGRTLFSVGQASQELGIKDLPQGEYQVAVKLPTLWLVPGLYSLHFKTILWGQTGSKHLSDKFPLDVEGMNSSSRADRILHPKAEWAVT